MYSHRGQSKEDWEAEFLREKSVRQAKLGNQFGMDYFLYTGPIIMEGMAWIPDTGITMWRAHANTRMAYLVMSMNVPVVELSPVFLPYTLSVDNPWIDENKDDDAAKENWRCVVFQSLSVFLSPPTCV